MNRVKISCLSNLPECSAVYFVMDGNRCLYVGKARNLKHRWTGHHRHYQLLTDHPSADLIWLEIEESHLVEVESQCIEQIKPKLNRTKVFTAKPTEKLETWQDYYRLGIDSYGLSWVEDLPKFVEKNGSTYERFDVWELAMAGCNYFKRYPERMQKESLAKDFDSLYTEYGSEWY